MKRPGLLIALCTTVVVCSSVFWGALPAAIMIGVVFFTLQTASAQADELPALRVSDNGRFLVKDDDTPFFYLGDTAWSLFERLDREEVDFYLEDRASKGFNVIQAVVIFEGGIKPNVYGHEPFIDKDPSRPSEAYFRHVDYVVDKAESLGLYTGMLPVWAGTHIRSDQGLFNSSNIPATRSYGRFLGKRYRDKPIIWILGGDWPGEGIEDICNAMAQGLAEGDDGRHLMTYHPRGGQASSTWFHNDAWLDFNMIQSSHSIRNRNYDMVDSDYKLKPVKPVIDGENNYENITDGLKNIGPDVPILSAFDVRRPAYCGVFSGAAGHTYGCSEIYQFWVPGMPKASWGSSIHWKEAINLPGASQMQYLRNLIESRPMLTRIPDQSIIVGDPMRTTDRVQATRDLGGSYAFVYIASGKPVTVHMDKISGTEVKAYWYDPRDGTSQFIGQFPDTGVREFTPPSSGIGNDWVLVLDDAAKDFPTPGSGTL